MDNYIGKKIEGRYQVNELIGVGGMANVYKATDITDGKTVAIKILREEFYSNEEFLRRFKNESKAIALLSHPNIIKVYDVVFTNKMQSIVMEFVDGITLKEYMELQGKLLWKDAVHFLLQILKALAHAHDKGIVHRDIKPQNVMLLPDGSIKITDFGIARFARSESRTLTDRAIGSVHYISPEQARGGHTDQRADIYSIGVMLFEMLTGQLPFDADSPVTVALKQIELDAPTPRSINPEVPEGLEEITIRAMEKDPEKRYQSASEMLKDIEEFKQNPSARFEYQYMTNEELDGARYRKVVNSAKNRFVPQKTPVLRGRNKNVKGAGMQKPSVNNEKFDTGEWEKPRGSSVVVALFGITAAFVVITIVFISAMLYLNNPLEKVPDVEVPDFVGLNYDAIRNSDSYSGFIIEVEDSQYNDLFNRGDVISQKPKSGTKVKENSIIRLVISEGQQVVQMPNLIGMEETLAYKQLAELGMEYSKSDIFSDNPSGTVVATDPGFGSEISTTTVVKLQISMGPENKIVEVPDVMGKTLDEARAIISGIGLEVGGISYISSDEPSNTVLFQDPAPTSQLSTGGLVNLNVSGGENVRNRITLHIPLPSDETEIVKIQAMFNGNVIKEERLQPSTALYWKPMFEGTGVARVFILYNDFLYQTFELDFGNVSYKLIEDNSREHS